MASDREGAGRDVLVDSNVILDVLTEDPRWLGWSSSHLARLTEDATLVLNPIVTRDARRYRAYFPTVELIAP